MTANCSCMFSNGLRTNAGQAQDLVLVQLQGQHQIADVLVAGLDQYVEDVFLQAQGVQW